jgi:proline iminopeptidase
MNRRDFVALGAVTALSGAGLFASASAQTASAQTAPATVERVRRKINGVELAVSMAGPADGTPMVVLHGGRGYGTHGGVFRTYLPLANRYRLIGFDMRGHGESGAVGPYTFDQLVDDLEAVRQTLGGGRKMVLLGGSFGGMIALSYAVKHQANLDRLILRGTAPSWRHEAGAVENLDARAAQAPMATKEMLTKLFTPTIASDEEFRLIMFALAPMYQEDPSQLDLNALLATTSRRKYRADVHNDLFADHSYDVEGKLAGIRTRTLVFCGANDWICPPDQSQLIADSMPNADLHIVPDSNHGVPDKVALGLVEDFLAKA